ncbi:MAG: DUF3991 and toprim domain-containing protein [Oscillospiraceae bacterium]|jgi:hypothetical protein|nr:DUF3991 and toprim domain-containing protein [Oscillospiraceae bacterium]
MPWLTEDQIARAREIDLLTYLQSNEPNELLPPRSGEYRTVSHESLVISNGLWNWNRGGIGGRSALDYLVRVRGMKFHEAVERVLGSSSLPLPGVPHNPPPPKKYIFHPPAPVRYPTRVISYLQRRGICPEILRRAMELGILYESRYYNPNSDYHNAAVCVFAGKDESGKVVFAALCGIDTNLKIDKAGSDKRFSFHIPAKNPDSRHLAVFESPIDALSHATLQYRNGWQWNGYRLSLGGTSPVALTAFLERNPQITRVVLHLDNDTAGLTAARKIKAQLTEKNRRLRVSVNPPRCGKDYNDVLLRVVNMERKQKPPISRPSSRAYLE